jgi:uncharacterized membrane-anchored protein YjiN (DUF445 family)
MADTEFYTATMAKVYADQGYLEKAAEIYRYLLAREPGRQALRSALAAVEKQLAQAHRTASRDLSGVFEEWIDLMLRYKRLQGLKKFQRSLTQTSNK